MTDASDDLIRTGLRAWSGGDLDAVEAVLDERVTLRWYEPGDWDCVGRDQVMRLLRSRRASGRRPAPVSIDRLDETTYIVSPVNPRGWDDAEAGSVTTRITVANGMVVAMQQYRSRDDALTAAASR